MNKTVMITNNVLMLSSSSEDEGSEFEAPNLTGTPERRLLLAVLERAILDYVGNDTKEISEAEAWIFAEKMKFNAQEFSFQWVCEELDLDAAKIAQNIAEMPKRGNSKIAPWYVAKAKAAEAAKANAPVKEKKVAKVYQGNFPKYH